MLSDLTTTKNLLRVPLSDTSQDVYLSLLLPTASQIVVGYCRQQLENAIYTEFRDGNNAVELALYQQYVQPFMVLGDVTQGSTTVDNVVTAGVSGSTGLVTGIPIVSQTSVSPNLIIPDNTTIATVSGSSVTLSQAATQTIAQTPMIAGISVHYDPFGYGGYGMGAAAGGPFSPGTLLVLGRDFSLNIDQPNGSSKSGIIQRVGIAGGIGPGDWSGFGYGGSSYGGNRGGLTARLPPTWGRTQDGIKIVYYAGVGVGAPANGSLPTNGTQVPAELSMCCSMVVGWIRAATPAGVPMVPTDVIRQVSGQLSYPVNGEKPELSTCRYILNRYRSFSV